jgi:threonine/homoserine/homoserine lactone efflux protein
MFARMSIELLAALAVFAFVSSITPGPNNLMLMASGANFGVVKTLPHMLGVAGGFTLMIVLIGLGLARLFEAAPAALIILKIASVVYLLYLAWRVATASALKSGAPVRAKPLTFLEAAAFQWVNPKAWAMALTAIAAYAQPENLVFSVCLVALVFGAINLPSVGVWTGAGAQLRRFLTDPRRLRVFNITAGVLLAATAIPIAFGAA